MKRGWPLLLLLSLGCTPKDYSDWMPLAQGNEWAYEVNLHLKTGVAEVKVEGPTALAEELVNRDTVGACFGAFYASFSFGFDQKDSACLVSTPREKLAAGELTLLQFLTSITSAPHFTTRVDQ